MAFPVTLNGRTYTLTDFEGTNYVDGLPDAFEDFVTHAGDIYNSTSTTSNSIGTGSKTFTVEANKPYQAGTPLRIADAAAPSTNFLDTVVTSYSGTTLVVNSIGYGGSGTKTSWTVNIGGAKTVDGTLGLSQGGTGATDAAGARTNIDVYSKSETDTRYLNISGDSADISFGANMSFGDNNKIIMGAGSDLEIYHNSSNNKSYIEESGAGNLVIRGGDIDILTGNGEAAINVAQDGAVTLYNDNDAKLATTSSGVEIKNTSDPILKIQRGTGSYSEISSDSNGTLYLRADEGNTTSSSNIRFEVDNSEKMRLDEYGQLILQSNTSSIFLGGTSTGSLVKGTSSGDYLIFGTSASEKARFIGSNFGIGTTSARQLLHVNQKTASSDAIVRITNTNTPSTGGHRVEFADGEGTSEGSSVFRYAYIAGERSGGSNDGHFIVGTKPDSSTSPREHLRVSSSGELTITGTYNGNARDDAYVIFGIKNSNGDSKKAQIHAIKTADTSSELIFSTTAAHTFDERMRINAAGIVLIGRDTAINMGSNSDTGMQIQQNGQLDVYRNSNPALHVGRQVNNGPVVKFAAQGTSDVGSIDVTTSSTSYTTSSDYRLKENVVDLTGATARLNQLAPKRFNFIVDDTTTVDGFLAHEVSDIVPEAIRGTKDEVETWTQEEIDAGDAPANTSAGDNKIDGDGNTIPVHQGIDQSKLVPLLVATIQELEARITALENA